MKYTLLCIVFCVSFVTIAQKDTTQYVESEYISPVSDTIAYEHHFFEDNKLLRISLRYDITSSLKSKAKQEEQYFPAELVIYLSATDSIVKQIRVKARGNFRKQHCHFPPVHLNFKTDRIKQKDFEVITKIKMVTHCKMSKAYEEYVLKEYLIYKMYNKLTDNSLRVRLLRITYEDTGKRKHHLSKYGFLIEPTKMLAQRQNSIEIESRGLSTKEYVQEDLDRIALFNYMIGNTDWRISGGHNIKFFKVNDPFVRQLNVVPYDFDYAGFVDTEYAIPSQWSDAETVLQRDYLGYCWDNPESIVPLVNLFKEKREEIYKEIREFEYLTERQRSFLEQYISEFYDDIDNQKYFLRMIKNNCTTPK